MPAFRLTPRERRPWPSRGVILVFAVWGGSVALFTLINELTAAGRTACMFKSATLGVPCPTCGSTRLVLYSLSGRVLSALVQNPLVFAFFAGAFIWAVAAYGFKRRIELTTPPLIKRAFILAVIALFFANWAYVVAIDGPFDNPLAQSVEEIQSADRGIYRFFPNQNP